MKLRGLIGTFFSPRFSATDKNHGGTAGNGSDVLSSKASSGSRDGTVSVVGMNADRGGGSVTDRVGRLYYSLVNSYTGSRQKFRLPTLPDENIISISHCMNMKLPVGDSVVFRCRQ